YSFANLSANTTSLLHVYQPKTSEYLLNTYAKSYLSSIVFLFDYITKNESRYAFFIIDFPFLSLDIFYKF
ncbi:AgrD family cyclic lactone autoinducer peptide, partial [Clostridioides difficile]